MTSPLIVARYVSKHKLVLGRRFCKTNFRGELPSPVDERRSQELRSHSKVAVGEPG